MKLNSTKSLLLVSICVIIFLSMSNSIYAQINKLNIPEKKESELINIKPYDSLTQLNSSNYLSHIGQTIYLLENERSRENGGYSDFYTKPVFTSPYAKDDNSFDFTYKPANPEYSFGKTRYSEYELMKNKYFYIEDIIEGPTKETFNEKLVVFKLIENETKDTIYYSQGIRPLWKNKNFITVGYFEKLKNTYIGEVFITQTSVRFDSAKEKGEKVVFNKDTRLKCIDIALNEEGKEDRFKIIAVLENEENQDRAYVSISRLNKKSLGTSYSFNSGGYRSANAELRLLKSVKVYEIEANEKKELARKYGTSNAELIVNGQVKLGFTEDMSIIAWGKPKSINKSTSKYGVDEQWVYGYNSYLYFSNGKVTAIQE